MNKDLTIFNFNEKQVRTSIDEQGNPWFCIIDVCEVLNIKNDTEVASRLDKDGVGFTDVIDNMGRKQKAKFCNEPNLYLLIMRSNKPEAVKFQMWIANDVIPSIRKTGSYSVKAATQIDLMYMILDNIKEVKLKEAEQDQKLNKFEGDLIEAKATFSELSKKAKAEIIRKEKLAIKNLPDADMNFDQFSKYLKSYLNINIGRDRLFQFVKELKHIFVDNSQNRSTYTVYQTYLDQGLYKMLVRSYKAKPGSDVKYTYNQIIITPKGQLYLIEKLKAAKLEVAK